MKQVFNEIMIRSYQASIVILIILVARNLLATFKVPKRYIYGIWLIPFIRLISPFSVESIFSLLPKESSPIKGDFSYIQAPKVYSENGGGNSTDAVMNQNIPVSSVGHTSSKEVGVTIFLWLWLLGIAVLTIYCIVSYIRLRKRLACGVLLKENIYLADTIDTPFVLGFVKPHIYVPSSIGESEMEYVLSHERMHIKRGDTVMKGLTFLITCVYWFNPLAWLAFTFLSKDMEMSCDEAVLSKFGEEGRKEYATTLLNLTTGKKYSLRKSGQRGIPLAFGEGDTKGRIKNIMNYRKPKVIISALTILVIFGLIVGLLTSPTTKDQVEHNNHALKEALQKVEKDTETVYLNDIIPFEWTEVYTFDPYLSKEQQENIIGFKSDKLKESNNEDMVHLVFVNKDEVVSCILGYPQALGYNINLRVADYTVMDTNYVRVTYEQNAVFLVRWGEGILSLDYQPEGKMESKEAVSSTITEREVISITPPEMEYNANLGADGPSLDYAGNGIVIFHGYFGLFVYSMEAKGMVGAVDLAAIGCDYTQGDNYCEVMVSADGGTVYLHPISETYMYVYQVSEQELYKTAFSLEGVELFNDFVDSSFYMEGNIGYYSSYGVEYDGQAGKYYGYLQAEDWTMESLKYIEDEKEVSLLQEYFNSSSEGNYPKLYHMSVIQSDVSDIGATFEIYNDSDQAIDYGEDFRIKRNVSGAWVNVVYATEHFGFQDVAYSIPANEASVVKISWELLYGKLPVGQYRLIKDIHVKDRNGKYKVISLAAEFEIWKGSGYAKALNDDEIEYIEKLAKSYYEEEFIFDLLSLSLAKEDTIYTHYPEYEPGNIAVFQAETTHAGKGVYRYIVYAREDKKSEWVKINEGK